MKKIFEKPSIVIDRFEVEDVLTTSQPTEGTGVWEGYDGPSNPNDGGVDFGDDFW